jgi:hypothetical protein
MPDIYAQSASWRAFSFECLRPHQLAAALIFFVAGRSDHRACVTASRSQRQSQFKDAAIIRIENNISAPCMIE